MVTYTTTILKFKEKGEKSGWTYIEVPPDVTDRLKKNNKKSFRVKGRLDSFAIKGIALLPMGGGSFIMPLNASLRKGIGKRHGATLKVQLEADNTPFKADSDFMDCLSDEPNAFAFFKTLPKSHQDYFSKWIGTAKSEETKAKRIAMAVNGLAENLNFGEMLRANKSRKLTS